MTKTLLAISLALLVTACSSSSSSSKPQGQKFILKNDTQKFFKMIANDAMPDESIWDKCEPKRGNSHNYSFTPPPTIEIEPGQTLTIYIDGKKACLQRALLYFRIPFSRSPDAVAECIYTYSEQTQYFTLKKITNKYGREQFVCEKASKE